MPTSPGLVMFFRESNRVWDKSDLVSSDWGGIVRQQSASYLAKSDAPHREPDGQREDRALGLFPGAARSQGVLEGAPVGVEVEELHLGVLPPARHRVLGRAPVEVHRAQDVAAALLSSHSGGDPSIIKHERIAI